MIRIIALLVCMGFAGLAQASLIDDFETGDFSRQAWSFAGQQPWTIDSAVAAGGSSYSARSGQIGPSSTSSLILSLLTEAGQASFDYLTSSETSFDFLKFFIDGTEIDRWSGRLNGFQSFSTTISAGAHTFEWRYQKDGSVNSGLDTVWIDNFRAPVSGESVPASATLFLFGLGLAGLGWSRRKSG